MSIKAVFNVGHSYSIHAMKLYFWISLKALGIKCGIDISWRIYPSLHFEMTTWWNIQIIAFIYIFMSISELSILSLILFSYLVIMSGWFSKYIFYCSWADIDGFLNYISFHSIGLPFLEQRTWAILYIYHEVLEETSSHGPQHPWKWKPSLAFPLYPFPFPIERPK